MNEQYLRNYVGDRLFYRWNSTLVDYVDGIYLSDVIKRNVNLQNISTDSFSYDSSVDATSASSNSDGYNYVVLLELSFYCMFQAIDISFLVLKKKTKYVTKTTIYTV